MFFEEQPAIKYGDCLDIWKTRGPIQVQDWISNESIRLNPELKTVIDEEMNDKGVYTGQVNEKGQRHGLGRWIWNGGQVVYEGTFCENKYHGFGRFIDVYSFCYVGQFDNGLRQGKGTGTDGLGIVKDG